MADNYSYRREYPFYQYMQGRGNRGSSYLNFKPYMPTFIGRPVQEIGQMYQAFDKNLRYINDVQDALDVAMSDAELGIKEEDWHIAQRRKDAIRTSLSQVAESGNFRAAGLIVNKALKDFQTDNALKAARMRAEDYDKKMEEIRTSEHYHPKQKEFYLTHTPFTPTTDVSGYYPTTFDAPTPAPMVDMNKLLLPIANSIKAEISSLGLEAVEDPDTGLVAYWTDGENTRWSRERVSKILEGVIAGDPNASAYVADLSKAYNTDDALAAAAMAGMFDEEGNPLISEEAYQNYMDAKTTELVRDIARPYVDAIAVDQSKERYIMGPAETYKAQAKLEGADIVGREGFSSEGAVGTEIQAESAYQSLGSYLIRSDQKLSNRGYNPITGTDIHPGDYKTMPSKFNDVVNRLAKVEGYTGEDITQEPSEVKDKIYPKILDFYNKHLTNRTVNSWERQVSGPRERKEWNSQIFGVSTDSPNVSFDAGTLRTRWLIDLETAEVFPGNQILDYVEVGDNGKINANISSIVAVDNPYVLYTGIPEFSAPVRITVGSGDKQKDFIVSAAPVYGRKTVQGIHNMIPEYAFANELGSPLYTNATVERRTEDGYVIRTGMAFDEKTLWFEIYNPFGAMIDSGYSASGEDIYRNHLYPIVNNKPYPRPEWW